MPKTSIPHDMMLDALTSISEATGSDKQLSAQFRAAVVAFASETPDNMNCVDRINVELLSNLVSKRSSCGGLILV